MTDYSKVLGELQDFNLGEVQKARYYRLISQLLENLHSQIPNETYDTQRVAAPTDIREEFFEGGNYQRAVMFLLTNGCEWALKGGHGCTMCGHLAKQVRSIKPITAQSYLHQFNEEFHKIDFKQSPLLNVFNNGSFFNDHEIFPEVRKEILKTINRNKHIKMLVLETRPEFVTAEKIREVYDLISGKHIEIAIGLEIKDDVYRIICINKGFSLHQYEQAARLILRYLHLRTYVLLKPPFLTEREAIDNAVETIEHTFKVGSTTTSLEACTIQDYTLCNYLYERGFYSTPWLWSIIEVVKRVRARTPGKLIIGLFRFYPSPAHTPFNCEKCSDRVLTAISHYNRTLDVTVFDHLSCQCKEQWQSALEEESPDFEERLQRVINQPPGDWPGSH